LGEGNKNKVLYSLISLKTKEIFEEENCLTPPSPKPSPQLGRGLKSKTHVPYWFC